jgi:uncharacterized protein YceK
MKMRFFHFPALAALVLAVSGCGSVISAPPPASAGNLPAPAAIPAPIDEEAIKFGFKTLAAVGAGTDLLVDAGVLKPGSPAALRVADVLDGALTMLNAASTLQRAASTAIVAAQNLQARADRSKPESILASAQAAAAAWSAVDAAQAAWAKASAGVDMLRASIMGAK